MRIRLLVIVLLLCCFCWYIQSTLVVFKWTTEHYHNDDCDGFLRCQKRNTTSP